MTEINHALHLGTVSGPGIGDARVEAGGLREGEGSSSPYLRPRHSARVDPWREQLMGRTNTVRLHSLIVLALRYSLDVVWSSYINTYNFYV
ncbi:hypothetical protein NDU88_002694 [Pleurodeles waltl]|uniref:Uncharacterized protein n=1 Tax=Pleurodeles waltl TaxID=8319 RepID=A0AAV7SFP5_PLEWA|nr:hypothetical protein NDU88_002694 [Pleurodeles waltl]